MGPRPQAIVLRAFSALFLTAEYAECAENFLDWKAGQIGQLSVVSCLRSRSAWSAWSAWLASRQNLFDHVAVDVGEAKIPSLETVGESFVVDPQQV